MDKCAKHLAQKYLTKNWLVEAFEHKSSAAMYAWKFFWTILFILYSSLTVFLNSAQYACVPFLQLFLKRKMKKGNFRGVAKLTGKMGMATRFLTTLSSARSLTQTTLRSYDLLWIRGNISNRIDSKLLKYTQQWQRGSRFVNYNCPRIRYQNRKGFRSCVRDLCRTDKHENHLKIQVIANFPPLINAPYCCKVAPGSNPGSSRLSHRI
jgi:hypothetical protein